ncbi:MAG TPA: hypothetical protein VF937_11705, partial [Chloroflexota bacterium]
MLARPAVKTTVAPLPSTAPGLPAPAAGPPPPHGLRQHVLGLVMLVAMLALSALAIAPYIPR